MSENITLSLFCLILLACVAMEIPLLAAMVAGLMIFWLYAIYKGNSIKKVLEMSWQGVSTIKNILMIFLLIGVLTGLWRAAGTIPVIIVNAVDFIMPENFLLMVFLLNCGVSVLMGTSFGTAATMGVITMMISNAMGFDPMWTGGAILSGIYFGDRWSAVSTSALLVATLTKTDLYDNLKRMVKTAAVPFIVSCIIYLGVGFISETHTAQIDIVSVFSESFNLDMICAMPALVILISAALRVKVRKAMLMSVISALVAAYYIQGESLASIFNIMLLGYVPHDDALKDMLSGGGIISMLDTTAIVCVASCYAGIFAETPLLKSVEDVINRLSQRLSAIRVTAITSVIVSCIACNQTLAIMMAEQLCHKLYDDKQEFAVDLEDTAVVISPLIPWCIAGAVPLAIVGAPMTSFGVAVYLYLLPIYRCFGGRRFDINKC